MHHKINLTINTSTNFIKMKKFLTGFAILGSLAFISAQTIAFDQTTLDYGTVKTGSDGHRYFVVKNTGDKPLVISKVQPGCGCTVPEWSKDPIMPGKTSLIKVGYSGMNQKGAWGPKMIEITSNDPKNSRTVLNIKGNVADDGAEYVSKAPTEKEQLEIFRAKEKEQKQLMKSAAKADKKKKIAVAQ